MADLDGMAAAAGCRVLWFSRDQVALWLMPGVVPELLAAAFREAAGEEGQLTDAADPALGGAQLLRVAAVRNPYTRIAALAAEAGTDPAALLEAAAPPGQAQLLGPGRTAFAHVIQFEALETDLPAVLSAIFGAPAASPPVMPPAPPEADADACGRIAALHAEDFRLLGYPADRRFRGCNARRLHLPVAAGRGYRLEFGGPPPETRPSSAAFRAAWQHIGAGRRARGRLEFAAIARAGTGCEAHRAFDAAAVCQMKGPDGHEGCDGFLANPGHQRFAATPAPVYLASQALWRDDWDSYWALAPALPAWHPAWFGPWNRGLTTRVERGTACRLDRMARATLPPPEADKAPVVLMAADAVYAERHGEAALRSCREAGETDIVLAIANPGPELSERFARLAGELGGIELRLLPGVPAERAYYASLRYLIAPALMRARARPVFVCDIDIHFRESLAAFFARRGLDRDRIGLRISPKFCFPWQRITVNSVYLPCNREGLAFAEHMRLFLEMQFSVPASPDLWWIDQNAALSASAFAPEHAVQRMNVGGFVDFPK